MKKIVGISLVVVVFLILSTVFAFGALKDAARTAGYHTTLYADNINTADDTMTAVTVDTDMDVDGFVKARGVDVLFAQLGDGAVASGGHSSALGPHSVASGWASVASGWASVASGIYSVALGHNSNSSGRYSSTAVGHDARASASYSSAFGYGAAASGDHSTAVGRGSYASGDFSSAFGYGAAARHYRSTAIGHGVQTYANDEIRVGRTFHKVIVDGDLAVNGDLSVNNKLAFTGSVEFLNSDGNPCDLEFTSGIITNMVCASNLIGGKSVSDCSDAGGTVYSTPDGAICRFASSSCPSGWSQYRSWSSTSSNECGYIAEGEYGRDCAMRDDIVGECMTLDHSFSDAARESCTYDTERFYYYPSGSMDDSYCDEDTATCRATITSMGCN